MEDKLTPHRRAVLELVRSAADHPTAREVFERSAAFSPRLSFATVYNALKYLSEKKLLRAIRVGDAAVRYDSILDRHHHLVCRICGGIDDAAGGPPSLLNPASPAIKGFLVEDVTVQFHGVCAQCGKGAKGAKGAKGGKDGKAGKVSGTVSDRTGKI